MSTQHSSPLPDSHPQRPQPVQLQRDFATHWNGYDRAEVRSHLARISEEIRQLTAERDAAAAKVDGLSRHLGQLRTDNDRLRSRVDELLVPPERLEDLDERMQRVGQLAHLQAEEVTTRAQAASEETWRATAQASISLRERYRTLLKELDKQAEELHAEHRAALEDTRAEVQALMVDAVRRREALDAESERKRRAIEQEFDATMAAKRTELDKYLTDQRTAAKQQAERRMANAQSEAHRMVTEAAKAAEHRTTEANRTIAALLSVGRAAHGRMEAADRILASAEEALAPVEGEDAPILPAEEAVPAPEPEPLPDFSDETPAREPVTAAN